MYWVRCSLVVFLLSIATNCFAVIGLCPTPVGPIGIVPCDTGCTGVAIMQGSLKLSTAYQQYINTISKASAKLTQCTVSSSNTETRFRAKLTSVGTKLNTTLIVASKREIHSIDGLTLKVGEIFSKYMIILQGLYLETSRTLTANAKSFVKLLSIGQQSELPSTLGEKLASYFYDGIEATNTRTEDRSLALLKDKIEIKTYQSLINRNGKSSLAAKELASNTNGMATELFNQQAEYFVPPSFTPTTIQVYTDADLKLANLFSNKEKLCLEWQSILDTSYYSCGYYSSDLTATDLSKLIDTKKAQQNDSVNKAFNDVTDKAFALKDSMASSECLKGLMGFSQENKLVNISDYQYFKLLQAMRDYLFKTGCTAMTAFFNSQIKLVEGKINDVGDKLSQKTYGLASIKAETNTDGVFGASGSITPILDSELGKTLSKKVNGDVNKRFFGTEKPYGNDNYIDLTDKKYRNGTSSTCQSSTAKVGRKTLEEKVDEAVCNLTGC